MVGSFVVRPDRVDCLRVVSLEGLTFEAQNRPAGDDGMPYASTTE